MKPKIKLKNDGSMYRLDAWNNAISGQGHIGTDKSQATRFSPAMFGRMDQLTLGALYRFDWLSRKICQKPADDATRKFIELKGLDEQKRSEVNDKLELLGIKQDARQAIAWSRLYGGAAWVYIYEDGKSPEQPLEINGSRLLDVIVLDRYNLTPEKIDDDVTSAYFGLPLTYRARNNVVYHRSRLSLFDGADLTLDQRITEQHWGGSYVELAYEAIKSLQGGMQDANFLLQDSGIGILKMPGLNIASAMGGGITQALMNRATLFNQGKSIYRTGIIDTAESFDFINRSLQGVPDILDRFMTVVSGAVELPELVLFGKSPSGLNASQEEQLAVYYDTVRSIQEDDLMRALNRVMLMIEGELGIEKIDWDFCPLMEMSSDKKSTIMLNSANAVVAINDAAALEPGEVRRALNETGVWNLPEEEAVEEVNLLSDDEDVGDAGDAPETL